MSLALRLYCGFADGVLTLRARAIHQQIVNNLAVVAQGRQMQSRIAFVVLRVNIGPHIDERCRHTVEAIGRRLM